METQLVKVHTQKEIEDIAKNYKLCTVEDMNGKKVTSWNTIKKPIKDHLKECFKRLELDIYPQGYYNICFAQAVRYQKDHNDKYIYCKGTPPKEFPQQNNFSHLSNTTNKNELLSVTSALAYITEIAELKTEKNRLEMELKNLKEENVALEAELAEYEREEESGLSEKKGSDTMEFLKDQAPTIMATIDRFFEFQDKKLNLEEKKLNIGKTLNKDPVKRSIKKFEIGSDEHLNYIRLCHKQEKEEQMNKELDKLEAQAPEKYELICNELNLFEDETNND